MSIFKIVFILCLINNSALASLTDLSCSQNGTKVLFINGVFIDDKAFASFKIDAENFFGKLDYTQIDINNKELLIPDYRHNQSEGKLRDIAEAYFLYLIRDETKEEMPLELALKLLTASLINDNIQLDDLCKSNNTRETCKEIKKIILNNEKNQTMMDLGAFKDVAFEALVTNKQKLIFVTHSGGNLMADRVRDYVKLNLPKEYYDLTGHVSLARPYNTQHKNVETLVFDQDGVIASLRIAGQNTPDGNVDLIEPCDTFRFLPWFNHGFDCYLGDHKVKQTAYDLPDESPSVDVVKAAIYKVASNLGNNDYSCCKKKPGKFRRNADGSPGGFVSNDLKITTGDIFVQAGAKICATGEILATNDPTKHFFGASVKLNGKFFSDSQFEISGNQVISSETSEIISKLGSTKSFTLKNSEIDGKLELKTNSSVVHPNPIRLSGNFYGSNILNGNISITYVNLRNAILTGNFDLFGVFALNNNASLVATSAPDKYSTLSNIDYSDKIDLNANTMYLQSSKFYGATNLKVINDLVVRDSIFDGSLSSQVSKRLEFQFGRYKSFEASCTGDLKIQSVGITQGKLKLSNCIDTEIFGLSSNSDLNLKGVSYFSGKALGGGTLDLGNKGAMSRFAGEVRGTISISAPNGFVMGNQTPSGYVSGNLYLVSNCANPVALSVGDVDFNLSHTYNLGQAPGLHCTKNFDGTLLCYGGIGPDGGNVCL